MFDIIDYGIAKIEPYSGNLNDIAVIVPAYNEEKNIESLLFKLKGSLSLKKVVVVDDGSIDDTPRILKKFSRQVDVVTNPTNLGKQGALKAGLEYLLAADNRRKTRFVFMIDADMQFDPAYILPLSNILDDNDIVFGNRKKDEMSQRRRFANAWVDFWFRLAGLNVDTQTGFVGTTAEIAEYRLRHMDWKGRYRIEQDFLYILARYAYENNKTVKIGKAVVPCIYKDSRSNIKPRDVFKLGVSAPIYSLKINFLRIKNMFR
jgi:glycosyltransferase involved in cell wall biosynthesis